nr:MAG TPA: hypothetical protein [Caudoviricetes sp.]
MEYFYNYIIRFVYCFPLVYCGVHIVTYENILSHLLFVLPMIYSDI